MRQTLDTAWQRRGTSWVWDQKACNQVCAASEVWSLRQFLRAADRWPEELPSNSGRTLVVAGLGDSLDLLTPPQAELWLETAIKGAILSFQDEFGSDGALVFWLPQGESRVAVHPSTDEVSWICGAQHRGTRLELGRILWGQANEYPQQILIGEGPKAAGLFHLRIT